MTDLILPRRKLLIGLGALFAAPAIVRAASIMPVKAQRAYYDVEGTQTFSSFDDIVIICGGYDSAPQIFRWSEMSEPSVWIPAAATYVPLKVPA